MAKGSLFVYAGTTGSTGAHILTEFHGITCVGGITAGVSGVTGYDVQVIKPAWGGSGEFYWVQVVVEVLFQFN